MRQLSIILMLWILIHFPTPGELKVIEIYKTQRECDLATILHPNSICTPTKNAPRSKAYYPKATYE